jgi:hypothetical protein
MVLHDFKNRKLNFTKPIVLHQTWTKRVLLSIFFTTNNIYTHTHTHTHTQEDIHEESLEDCPSGGGGPR